MSKHDFKDLSKRMAECESHMHIVKDSPDYEALQFALSLAYKLTVEPSDRMIDALNDALYVDICGDAKAIKAMVAEAELEIGEK